MQFCPFKKGSSIVRSFQLGMLADGSGLQAEQDSWTSTIVSSQTSINPSLSLSCHLINFDSDMTLLCRVNVGTANIFVPCAR